MLRVYAVGLLLLAVLSSWYFGTELMQERTERMQLERTAEALRAELTRTRANVLQVSTKAVERRKELQEALQEVLQDELQDELQGEDATDWGAQAVPKGIAAILSTAGTSSNGL